MSDFQISVHHPDLPDDTEFDIQGVGLVKNGGNATVTESMQEFFKQDTGLDLKDCLEENPIIGVGKKKPNTVSGSPTPSEQNALERMRELGGTEATLPLPASEKIGPDEVGGES